MGKHTFERGSGLLITPCNSIHTFFMKFSLDVIYLIENIPPWRYTKIVWNAVNVIELPAGAIKESHTSLGDKLSL